MFRAVAFSEIYNVLYQTVSALVLHVAIILRHLNILDEHDIFQDILTFFVV